MNKGDKAKLFLDRWIPHKPPLRELIEGPLPHNGDNITVGTLLTDGGWNLSSISFELPPAILQYMEDTLAHSNPTKEDIMYWSTTPNGRFTTNSVYTSIAEKGNAQPPFDFPWIWKLPAPNKIKTFILLLAHGRLQTKYYLHRLGITNNSSCSLCRHSCEDIDHIFLTCTNASTAGTT